MLPATHMETETPISVTHVLDQIFAVKQELAFQGVQEQDIYLYMPGVIATNIGAPLPVPHGSDNGPMLPKGLMAREVFCGKTLRYDTQYRKAKDACHDIALELKAENLKATWPATLVDVIKNKLDHALYVAGHHAAMKTQFFLEFTPCDAEAFYAKITPLVNKYEALAEQLKNVKRDLV